MKTNTKFIKVSVSDRLPGKEGLYCTNLGTLLFYKNSEGLESFKNLRNEEVISKSRIDFWLEEVPDYEDQMKDMLEDLIHVKHDILQALDHANNSAEDYQYLFDKSETLLTKLK